MLLLNLRLPPDQSGSWYSSGVTHRGVSGASQQRRRPGIIRPAHSPAQCPAALGRHFRRVLVRHASSHVSLGGWGGVVVVVGGCGRLQAEWEAHCVGLLGLQNTTHSWNHKTLDPVNTHKQQSYWPLLLKHRCQLSIAFISYQHGSQEL